MTPLLADLRAAIVVASVATLAFVAIEVIYGSSASARFPVALFAFLWLLAWCLAVTVIPLARRARTSGPLTVVRLSAAARLVLALAIGSLWVSLLLDQLPCFLGVPNCD